MKIGHIWPLMWSAEWSKMAKFGFFLKCIMLYIVWKLTARRVWKWTYWPHLTTRVTCRVVKNGRIGFSADIHHVIHHSKVQGPWISKIYIFTTFKPHMYHKLTKYVFEIHLSSKLVICLPVTCFRNLYVYPSHIFEIYMFTRNDLWLDVLTRLSVFKLFRSLKVTSKHTVRPIIRTVIIQIRSNSNTL